MIKVPPPQPLIMEIVYLDDVEFELRQEPASIRADGEINPASFYIYATHPNPNERVAFKGSDQ